MSFNLVTGRKAAEHVTSTQFRDIIRALAGNDTYIPDVNEKLKVVQTSSTSVTVRSGVLIHHGCVFEIPYGDGVSFTIASGEGVNKIYGIAVVWGISNGIESASIVCMDTTSGDYPGTQGNMQEGDTSDSVEIATVYVNGSNVEISHGQDIAKSEYTSSFDVSIPGTSIDTQPAIGAVVYLPAGYYAIHGNAVFQTATSQYLSQERNMQVAIYYQDAAGSGRTMVPQSMVRVSAPTGKYARLQATAVGYFQAGFYDIGATCTTPCSGDCRTEIHALRIR